MSNFFFRQSDLSVSDIETNKRYRNNAYVQIITGSNVILPVDANTVTSTYNYTKNVLGGNHTGRAAPTLGEVKIALEGEYGSLKKVEFEFICYDKPSFDDLEPKILKPGSVIDIKYGYAGPSNKSMKGSGRFRVYDFSFNISQENHFQCKVKAVGAGNDYEKLQMGGQQSIPDNLKFVTNYSGTNTTKIVQNYFDYWDYRFQVAYGRNDSKNFKETDGAARKSEFSNMMYYDNANGVTKKGGTTYGFYGILKAPGGFEASTRQNLGAGTRNRLFYTSLSVIVDQVNAVILKKTAYQMAFHKEWSKLNYRYDGADATFHICSASPFELLFPYTADTKHGNSYDPDDNSSYPIKMAKFNNDSAGLQYCAINGDKQDGNAAGILVCREMLRAIELDLQDMAKREDASTEESDKADGGMDIELFFKKLFATIRDNSGGAFDLKLDHRDGFDDIIFIINKKAPIGNDKVVSVKLDPISGKNGIRNIGIEGKVPKDIQAKAFGGDSTTTKSIKSMTDDEQETRKKATADETKTLKEKYRNARQDMTDRDFSSDTTTALKSVLKDIVLERDTRDVGNGSSIEPTPYPLSFKASFDGIEGLNFGDTFSSTYLPSRYQFDSGLRVVFTLIKYEHIIKDNDWETSIECISRIVDETDR